MKKLNKAMSVAVAAAMMVSLGACGNSADAAKDGTQSAGASGKVYNIGICQQLEHPALDQATQGFEDVLKEKLGDNVKFDLQNAQNEQANASTIANNFVSSNVADAIATSAGAVLGTSTTTTFVESSAGVGAGARTGLASIVTGLLFLLAIFFAPIFTAIPGFATAPALIFVGFLMVSAIVKVDFEDLTDAVPAYLCLIAMPLMYSIAEGIAIGVISFVLINLICGKRKKITPLMYILAVLFICKYIFL